MLTIRPRPSTSPCISPNIEFQACTAVRPACVHPLFVHDALSSRVRATAGRTATIEHSIAHGYYCRLDGYTEVSDKTVAELKEYMHRLADRDLPSSDMEDLTAEVCAIFERQGWCRRPDCCVPFAELYTTYYTLGGVSDSYYGALAPLHRTLAYSTCCHIKEASC